MVAKIMSLPRRGAQFGARMYNSARIQSRSSLRVFPCRQLSYTCSWRSNASSGEPLPFPLEESRFAQLRDSLIARELPVLYDTPASTPNHSLQVTLADFLPLDWTNVTPPGRGATDVSFGRHLIYFPPQSKLSELLPDATDPLQSPGSPFDRRMWAGGRIMTPLGVQSQHFGSHLPDKADRGRSVESACVESIADVKLKGSGKDQKLFVTLERRVGTLPEEEKKKKKKSPLAHRSDSAVRDWLSSYENCGLIERRDLVFMVPRDKLGAAAEAKGEPAKAAQKPAAKKSPSPGTPDFSASLVPTQSLLFRFSALTFNAHHIHLDKAYCRDVEGHRNLLFHGPLSCTMMLELLKLYIGEGEHAGSFKGQVVDFTYRNLAPLYAEETLKVCLRRKDRDLVVDADKAGNLLGGTDSGKAKLFEVDETYSDADAEGVKAKDGSRFAQFDCWVENSEGRMCVRGTAICLQR